jgi:hypothetical protein
MRALGVKVNDDVLLSAIQPTTAARLDHTGVTGQVERESNRDPRIRQQENTACGIKSS